MTWLTAFKDKNIVVLGAGMTGLSCLRFLHQQGLSFALHDSRAMPFANEALAQEYRNKYSNVDFVFGPWQANLLKAADIVIASPGIDLAGEGIEVMLSEDCQIIGDVELFCLVNNSLDKPMNMLAVTGSNGKSTVVSLLDYVAKSSGIHCALAGNIGEPILNLFTDNIASEQAIELVIVELSSFQLETLTSMKAIAASVLNLSDDHLDRHKTMANYQRIKQGIYAQAEVAIINRDDIATQSPNSQQKVISFGLSEPKVNEFGIRKIDQQSYLAFDEQILIALADLPLAGLHNALNYMAVLALGYCAGCPLDNMLDKLKGFNGLAHRCQRVVEHDEIQWINDSKATNIGATLAAISGLAPTLSPDNKLILIAGGDGKGADFSSLVSALIANVHCVITLGKDSHQIAQLVDNAIEVNTMSEAVNKARAMANSGDMVLLSPACASIDMYKNYMQRGDEFTALAGKSEVLCH